MLTEGEDFDPGRLLDVIKLRFGFQTDTELAKLLHMTSPQISRIRSNALPLSGNALIRIHEVSGLSIFELKKLCGDRRATQRVRKR
jgi:plasmid maintenance system antidote protein VapI